MESDGENYPDEVVENSTEVELDSESVDEGGFDSEASRRDELLEWNPHDYLESFSARRVSLSSGFLRSKPERWMPSIATQWLTLAHSLGVKLQILECVPSLGPAPRLAELYCGTLNGHLIGIGMGQDILDIISHTDMGVETGMVGQYVYEYLARRLFSSLTLSWMGFGEENQSVFLGLPPKGIDPFLNEVTCGVRLSVLVGDRAGTVWIALSDALVEDLDGLWKRQLHSTSGAQVGQITVDCELISIAIPDDEVFDFTKPGASVDLEIPVSDLVTLKVNGRPWLQGRLCLVEGRYAVEVSSRKARDTAYEEGLTEIAVRLTQFSLSREKFAEVSQPQSIIEGSQEASDRVGLWIGDNEIANAALKVYQGRFAIAVF